MALRSVRWWSAATRAMEERPVRQAIVKKIQEALHPLQLRVEDESHKHAGHAGNPTGRPDAETHFRVEVVSDAFGGRTLVQRHRMVYQLLDREFQDGLHALAVKAYTPDEIESTGVE
mmetsp:Transcript_47/g.415  ORF Transcript_47/g.415 Transcript_47/m.415 type:complete len:117 (+) Transcript_47:2763-3113(+)